MIYKLKIAFFLAALIYSLLGVFGQVKAKTPSKLETKVQQLTEMVSKKSIIRMNGSKFREYVKSPPRNYSVVVIFTAMDPGRQCSMCGTVHDEFTVVANSFRYSQGYSNQLFFAMVDFDEGSDVFQLLRLNTAPVIMHFPAKGKSKPGDTMDFERVGISAEAIAKWIQDKTDIKIRVFRSPNYSGLVAIVLLVSLFGGFLYLRRDNLDFLYNKQMWASGCIFFCFIMVSGQMWNRIRGPPFVHMGPNGRINFLYGSPQGQFVLESYIIMALYVAIVGGMMLLAEARGGIKAKNSSPSGGEKNDKVLKGSSSSGGSKKNRKRVMAIAGLILMCVFFSLLLSVFRAKAQGYPYRFLFN